MGFVSWIADFEINRRIESGESDGVMVLVDFLSIGLLNESTEETASEKAEKLTNGLVDINSLSSLGTTALHNAIATNRADVLKWLLDHGADPEARSDDERTPADMARERGHEELVPTLESASVQ